MKKLFLVLCILFISTLVISQTAEITNVRKKEFRGVYPIVNSATNAATGYYTFYVNEKVGNGKINFIIAIFDLELNLIKQTPITITKSSKVDGSEFNGKDFMFVFNDPSQKALTYVTVDSEGEIIKTKGVKEAKSYAATADVYSALDGFYIVKPIKEKKWGYSIEKVDRELNSKWEKVFTVDKGMVGVEAVEPGEDRIAVVQVTKPALLSAKAQPELVCLSDETGEELFSYPLYDGTVTGMPTAIVIDKNKDIVCGGMYFDGEKWDAANSDGIFFLKVNSSGSQLAYTKTPWEDGLDKFIKEGTKKTFTISSKPKVLFHQIVEGTNGNYQVIGETFKKSFQLVSMKIKDAITGRYIGDINEDNGNAKPMTFEVLDFVIFNFNATGEITNMNLIEKEHTKISCYPPYNNYGGLALAHIVEKFGFFNYAFTTTLPGDKQPLLISSNFTEKEPYIGINTIEEEKESVFNSIPITKKTIKGGGVGAMLSKPGWLGIYIYDKKEETITIYLQEIKI